MHRGRSSDLREPPRRGVGGVPVVTTGVIDGCLRHDEKTPAPTRDPSLPPTPERQELQFDRLDKRERWETNQRPHGGRWVGSDSHSRRATCLTSVQGPRPDLRTHGVGVCVGSQSGGWGRSIGVPGCPVNTENLGVGGSLWGLSVSHWK